MVRRRGTTSKARAKRGKIRWTGWLRGGVTPERLRRVWMVSSVLAVAIGVACGLRALKHYVYSLDAYRRPLRLQAVNTPPWLSEELRDRILQEAGVSPEDSLLDEDLVGRIAERLARSGWVRCVRRVEKHADGRITIDCAYRRPVAVVQQLPYYYLVDAEGVRLPGTYAAAGEWLIIQGVRAPAPPVGQAWGGPEVCAAARLAAMLIDRPFAEQLSGLRVSGHGGRLDADRVRIELVTRPVGSSRPPSIIIWGSPPGEEVAEPTAADKIAVLQSNYERGRIDAGYPWIDLTVGKNQFARPRGAEPHTTAWRS